jgi:hypothetical protein
MTQNEKRTRRQRLMKEYLKLTYDSPSQALRALGMDANPQEFADNVRRAESVQKSRSITDQIGEHGHPDSHFAGDSDWEPKVREFLESKGWDEETIGEFMDMMPKRMSRDDGEPEAMGRQIESRQNMRGSSTNIRPEYEQKAEKWNERSSLQREGTDRLPRPHLGQDTDLAWIHDFLGREGSGAYTGPSSGPSPLIEARSIEEVKRIRKLAGVGSGMGLDSAQMRSRSEKILDATLREQEREGRCAASFERKFPEAARIKVSP